MTPDEVKAADLQTAEQRRAAWQKRFAEQGPSWEGDMAQANPVFVRWLAGQPASTHDALRQFWASEVTAAPGVDHSREGSGAYARLALVIERAAEQCGYVAK